MISSRITNLLRGRTGPGAVIQTCFTNALIQGTNIICGIVTARALGPNGRGELAAIIMWPQFLGYAITLGIPVATVYHARRNPSEQGPLITTALISTLALGLVAALIGWLVIPQSLQPYSKEVISYARFAVLLAPLALFGVTLSYQAQSAGSFSHYNMFRIALPLLILLALSAESICQSLEPKTAALAYLLAGVPATIWNLVWVAKRFRLRIRFHFDQLKILLSYGVRAWGADLVGSVASQVDRLMVVGLLAPKLMGLYVVAQSAANLLNILPSAMVPVLMPKAVERSIPEIVALTGRATRITLLMLCAAGIPFMLIGGFLLHMMYGSRFDEAGGIFRLLVVESIIDGATSVLSQAFLSAGQPGTLALLEGVGLSTAIPCLVVLVPHWGLMGAGFAVLIATSSRLAFVLGNFPYRLKTKPPSLILCREDWLLLVRAT